MATLDDLYMVMVEIRDLLRTGGLPARGGGGSSAQRGAIADDADLDSQWGDPEIRKDPPRWDGPSFAGCRYSECTPEYLETLAGFLDWKADRDEEEGRVTSKGKPTAPYSRKDAARARGWAKRIREGRAAPAASQRSNGGHGAGYGGGNGGAPAGDYGPPPDDDFNDDIPF